MASSVHKPCRLKIITHLANDSRSWLTVSEIDHIRQLQYDEVEVTKHCGCDGANIHHESEHTYLGPDHLCQGTDELGRGVDAEFDCLFVDDFSD